MVPRQSLVFFVFLYVCFLSPAYSQNVFSWPYYKTFDLDWRLKEGSTAVKTATRPSAISESLAFLDVGRNEHDGDVWGLWDYGTESGTLSYKFNLTEYGSFFCGIIYAGLRIRYYSEGLVQGRILHCTGEPGPTNSDETVDYPCGLPATDSTENFGNVFEPVSISDKILEFEFTTQEGQIVIIEEVAIIYNVNPNDPTCEDPPEPEEETNQQEQPQPGRGKLEQILNQFKQSFKQALSFFNFFG